MIVKILVSNLAQMMLKQEFANFFQVVTISKNFDLKNWFADFSEGMLEFTSVHHFTKCNTHNRNNGTV